MAPSVGRTKFNVALVSFVLVLELALAIGFAVHSQWLVSGLCIVAAIASAASLYVRLQLLKYRLRRTD